MKRIAFVLAVVLATGIGAIALAPAANAYDSGNADGTQPVLSGDDATTCAIRESAAIYCWGANTFAQLGRGSTAPTLTVGPVASTDTSLAQAISMGIFTACAVLVDRTVKCWGYGEFGALGNGSPANALTPTRVTGLTNVATVNVGMWASCASKQDGTVWCWGKQEWGLAGFPSGQHNTAVKLPGVSNAVDVSVGQSHACALRVDKRVLCWGQNALGQLGDGTVATRTSPVLVKGIADAVAVVVGIDKTCALRAGGTIYCWGDNWSGALGARRTDAFISSPTPVFGISGATSVTMGPVGGCAVVAKSLKCWGNNNSGRLGDGQTSYAYAPVTATASLPNVTAATTSQFGTCEVANGGRIWCWGTGESGALGNESTASMVDGTGTGPGDKFGFAAKPAEVRILNTAPGKPAGSSTLAKKIKITWSAPSTSNGTSSPKDYKIQYRLKGTTTWKTFADSVSTSRSVTVTGLTSGKYYQFRVYPKNWAGTGTVSTASGYIKSR